MVIKFADEAIDCRHLRLLPRSFRINDLILYKGELCRVETIQRDCLSWHNRIYTMVTLRDAQGNLIPADSIFGTREVYRARS